MNIMVFDTETIDVEKAFCYNIGYVIFNTDEKTIVAKRDFVVEQVWHNTMLFNTAYYSNKKPIYISRLRGRSCVMEKFGYITQQMVRDIKEFDVAHAFAYNSSFDERVFEFNCDWFKCINPLELITVHDIRGHVFKAIGFTKEYKTFCEEYQLFTDSGNYSTTAEAVYRYVSGEYDFVEEHTALSDSIIECQILVHCVDKGCDWLTDYKVYRALPRNTIKQFEVVDANGNSYMFEYTSKRKLSGRDGLKFTVKM